jgi:SAM-dependent methyltransferase
MMMTAYPDYVARFYDVVYAKVRGAVDRDYYAGKLAACRGHSLEVGAGTGRIFLEALKRGADVYATDSSAEMVSILRAKLDPRDHHRVRRCDLVDMSLGKRFDLIVAPFRVLSHVVAVEDQLRALDTVHDHLNPGGAFIFDLYVPSLKLLVEGLPPTVDFDGEYAPGLRLKRTVSAASDLIAQITSVTMTFEWDEEGLSRSASWSFPMRFYFRHEIEHLVARSKLRLAAIYGDYSESSLDSSSKEFLVHCKR